VQRSHIIRKSDGQHMFKGGKERRISDGVFEGFMP